MRQCGLAVTKRRRRFIQIQVNSGEIPMSLIGFRIQRCHLLQFVDRRPAIDPVLSVCTSQLIAYTSLLIRISGNGQCSPQLPDGLLPIPQDSVDHTQIEAGFDVGRLDGKCDTIVLGCFLQRAPISQQVAQIEIGNRKISR